MKRKVLALTQGDPAGVGPEILLKLLAAADLSAWCPLVIAERSALEPLRRHLPTAPWERLQFLPALPSADVLAALDAATIAVVDPVGGERRVAAGRPTAADAHGALAALELGVEAAQRGLAQALVTAPLNKATVARHADPGFRGHTEYLAAASGHERYGRDHLMAFLAGELRVALLSTHLPLREALDEVRRERIVDALRCLRRHAGEVRIAVAGLNPHAGEGGLLGSEEDDEIRPAVEAARAAGLDVHGPASADSLFARAQRGEFDWVLALYHDQGLIAVKTAAFGRATHLTLGLPFLRTSVDHGTAYEIAGRGVADAGPLTAVIETTLGMLSSQPGARLP